jgi:hypothetical protein
MLPPITPKPSAQEIHSNPTPPTALKFKPGEIFRGTIIQKFSEGDFLVAAGGKNFLAHSALHLEKGENHHFQVQSLGPKIELKVLDGGGLQLRSPIELWALGRSARDQLATILKSLSSFPFAKAWSSASQQALSQLNQLLPAILYGEPGEKNALWLPHSLLASGLFWENKLARYLIEEKKTSWKMLAASDLKGLLLLLEQGLKTPAKNDSDCQDLMIKIQQALQLIEQDQFLNHASIRDGIGWFWFIPGQPEEGFQKAEIFIKQRDPHEEICFSLFLDLSLLGHMEVTGSMVASLLNLKIFVANEAIAEFVRKNLSLLEKSLKETGLKVAAMSCDVKEKSELEKTVFAEIMGQNHYVHLVI